MENQYCKDCRNYIQHYALNKKKILQVYCGHCTLHSQKRIKPDRLACDAFAEAQQEEAPFVTKEYLSKELLRYVLALDLLPEIGEMEGERQ